MVSVRMGRAVLVSVVLGAGFAASGMAADSSLITADGSSTVYPITEAVAEEFQKANPGVKATIGISGTGGGFKKFCAGETDISDASRPNKPTEVEACAQGKTTKWSQVRDGWPDNDLHLFGPGVDSGTYDYFTEAVVGKEHSSRGDFQSSEDDNTLVQGISADRSALGFFGFAYYEENKSKLKLLGVDDGKDENGKGCIQPSRESVEKGQYQPLARPLFIYVKKQSAERAEIQKFINFYLEKGPALVGEVGYIALPADAYKLAKKRFDARTTGSLFGGKGSQVGVTIVDLLKKEQQ